MELENRITVVLPTYNRAHLIGRAIKSVLAAVAPGDEVIVIDDGSTDGTEAIVRTFGDAVRFIRISNSGAGAARNLGIRLATCPLVAFLDSDDEWTSDKLELQRAAMSHFPEAVLCFSNLQSKLLDGGVVHDVLSIWRDDPRVGAGDAPAHPSAALSQKVAFSSIASLPAGRDDFQVHIGDIYPMLMEVLYATTSAALVRKAPIGDAFRFPEDMRIMDDWECFARVASFGPSIYLDCELAVQHVHGGARLTDADVINQATTRIKLLHRIWGSDRAFLALRGARYEEILARQYLLRAKAFIAKGRLREARSDLRDARGGPWPYRLLAMLPSPLVRGLFGMRHGLLSWRGHASEV